MKKPLFHFTRSTDAMQRKKRCCAVLEAEDAPTEAHPTERDVAADAPNKLDDLTVEDIDKQIELLTQLKISKMRGNSIGKRKLQPFAPPLACTASSSDGSTSNDSNESETHSKARRRFITQEYAKDPQQIRSLYYERREELLGKYSGQWIVFGLRDDEADQTEVFGAGLSALAAYYSAISSLQATSRFEVICVGSEDSVCRLPVTMVFNPSLASGADIYVC